MFVGVDVFKFGIFNTGFGQTSAPTWRWSPFNSVSVDIARIKTIGPPVHLFPNPLPITTSILPFKFSPILDLARRAYLGPRALTYYPAFFSA